MEPVIIRNSRRWPVAVLSAAATGLVVASILSGMGSHVFVVELISALLVAVLALWCLLDHRPQVVLDDRGILDRRLKVGVIPWSSIARAYARPLGSLEMVWVEMHGCGGSGSADTAVPLQVTGLGITTDQLLGLIAQRSAARKAK